MNLSLPFVGSGISAAAWFFLIPYADRAERGVGWALLVAGGMLLFRAGTRRREASLPDAGRGGRALRVVAAAVPCLLPFPWNVGFSASLVGSVLTQLRRAPEIAAGFREVGRVFALQATLLAAHLAFSPLTGAVDLDWVERGFALLLRAVGVEAVWDGYAAFSPVGDELRALNATLDSSGAVVFALMAVPSLVYGRAVWKPIAGLAAYCVLRTVALLAFASENRGLAGSLVLPWTTLLSFVPWLLFCAFRLRGAVPAGAFPAAAPTSRWPVVATGLGAAALAAAFCLVDPGTKKAGRILVDDAHGPWEPGLIGDPLADFGTDSYYNYEALWRYVGHHYEATIRTTGPLSSEVLSDFDVLVLKTPSVAYDAQEVAAIREWVAAGGGLVAIGDHTDVFGTTSCLNAALVPLGFEIERNVACLAERRTIGNYRFRPFGFGPNPLTDGVAGGFDFMGPAGVRMRRGLPHHALFGAVQAMDAADYRDGSFFGDATATTDDELRPFTPVVAAPFGTGRAVVFGDSTVFSNFSMFERGKPELAAALLAYANRKNGPVGAAKSALLAAAPWIAVALLALLFALDRATQTAALAAAAGAVVVAAAACSAAAPREGFGWPARRVPLTTVGVLGGDAGTELLGPAPGGLDFEQPGRVARYSQFTVAMLRADRAFPRPTDSVEDVAGLDALVVVDPARAPTPDELARLARAVDGGLTLVVVSSGEPSAAHCAPYAALGGMRFSTVPLPDTTVHRAVALPEGLFGARNLPFAPLDAAFNLGGFEREVGPGPALGTFGPGLFVVEGGVCFWSVGSSSASVLSRTGRGAGEVFACALGAAFSSRGLGNTEDDFRRSDPQVGHYGAVVELMNLIGRKALKADPQGPVVVAERPQPASRPTADPAARAALERMRGAPNGRTLRADVRVFGQRERSTFFVAGAWYADSARAELWLMGDAGTVKRAPDAPLAAVLTSGPTGTWVPSDDPATYSLRPDAGRGAPFGIPPAWRDFPWRAGTSRAAPDREFGRDPNSQSMHDVCFDTRVRLEADGRVPRDGFAPLPPPTEFDVLRTAEPVELGGGAFATLELWSDRATGLPAKLVASFRPRGKASRSYSWTQFVVLYDRYAESATPLPPEQVKGRTPAESSPALDARLYGR